MKNIVSKMYDHLPHIMFIVFTSIFILGVISSVVRADPLNGTEFLNDPFSTIFTPWTSPFEDIVGNGQVFWLFPVCTLCVGLYVKTRDMVTVSMFMIVTGAFLFTGSTFAGASSMATVFIIFTAFGITSLFVNLLLLRRTA